MPPQTARTPVVLAARGPGRAKAKPAVVSELQAAAEFRAAAQGHALKALASLAALAENASSEAVRVSAANSVIDRAHGRPAQAVRVGGGGDDESQGVELSFAWLSPEKS
jgi:hypothetical protein